MAAVDRDVFEHEPDDPDVGLQHDHFQLLEDAQLDPLFDKLVQILVFGCYRKAADETCSVRSWLRGR